MNGPVRVGKWMQAVEIANEGRKTRRWNIQRQDDGTPLGVVYWWGAWRQYVFEPNQTTIYAASCAADIATFLARVNREQREVKA